MNVTLNGEKKNVPDHVTVLGLLEFLQIQHRRVAVELNETIIKKDRYALTDLKEGDSLEVVSFMGGGQEVRSTECGMHSTRRRKCTGFGV